MTTILAIDASTETCSVAIMLPNGMHEAVCAEPRTHAGRILPMLDALLAEAGVSLHQIDAIAYGAGPGSFTGLRIALSLAQGLAFGLEKPLIPVESLHAMAYAFAQDPKHTQDSVVCLLDARMDEFYLASFQVVDALPQMLQPAQLCGYALFPQQLDITIDASVAGLGGGWAQVDPELRAMLGYCDTQAVPLASAIAQLGLKFFDSGVRPAAEQAEPLYLRNSVSWNKRQRLRQPTP